MPRRAWLRRHDPRRTPAADPHHDEPLFDGSSSTPEDATIEQSHSSAPDESDDGAPRSDHSPDRLPDDLELDGEPVSGRYEVAALEHRGIQTHVLVPTWRRDAPQPFMVGRALLRGWWIILLPALILLGVGLYVGSQRHPEYTANAQLNVGSIDVETQALPGFADGAKTLASAYSRVLISQSLVTSIARRAGIPPEVVGARLSSTPVPSSSIVGVTTTGPSARDAISLNNIAVSQLRAYVRTQERSSKASGRLLSEFTDAARAANRADATVSRLRRRRALDVTLVSTDALTSAETSADRAALLRDSLRSQYQDAVQRDQNAAQVQLLSSARSATDDRDAVLQQVAFVGFFGGAAIGVLLALLAEGSRRRRARRTS